MEENQLYEVEDIQKILGVGRTTIYRYIKQVYKDNEPFRVIKVGNKYRIPRKSFERWINGD